MYFNKSKYWLCFFLKCTLTHIRTYIHRYIHNRTRTQCRPFLPRLPATGIFETIFREKSRSLRIAFTHLFFVFFSFLRLNNCVHWEVCSSSYSYRLFTCDRTDMSVCGTQLNEKNEIHVAIRILIVNNVFPSIFWEEPCSKQTHTWISALHLVFEFVYTKNWYVTMVNSV